MGDYFRKGMSFLLAVAVILGMIVIVPSIASAETLTWGDYWYSVTNGEVTIEKYTGSGGNVLIPSEINGNPVTHIGGYTVIKSLEEYGAFYNCTSLTSVTIPNSVTSIGPRAFYKCTSLTSVTIPNSVTSIGLYAFYNCTSLTSVTIPYGVTGIGKLAFGKCTSLVSITLPEKAIDIYYDAFVDTACYNNSNNWSNGVFYIGKHLIKARETVSGSYSIKKNTIDIARGAFADCISLTNITIPDSVTSIGQGAFYNCSLLNEIIIPDSVTTIAGWAFEGCTMLDSVSLSNSLKAIEPGTFFGCTALNDIIIPDSVTIIEGGFYWGEGAFANCTKLESVTIGNSVTIIGASTFAECSLLKRITIPNSVTSIEAEAFAGCSSLADVTFSYGLTSIGGNAFLNCTSLTSVTIPDGVTSIGYHAFDNCTSLTSVTIPDGVTSIERGTFYNCTSLTSVTIPDSVTAIEADAFNGCSSITDIHLGSGLNAIRDGAFKDCTSLQKVYYNGTENDWLRKVYVGDYNEYLRNAEFIFGSGAPTLTHVSKKDATCVEDGNIEYWVNPDTGVYYSDALGRNAIDKDSVAIPALGHDFGDWSVTTKPTCTEAGEEIHTCARCAATETRQTNPLGHNYDDSVTKPTCTEPGCTVHTCSICGDIHVDTFVDALGHDWNDGVVTTHATDTEDGVMTYTCARCGETKTEVIPKTGKDIIDTTAIFTDVKPNKWYTDAVNYVYSYGLMNGMTDTTFEPNSPMSRAMLVTVLWRAEGSPEPASTTPFTDLKAKWYKNAVAWAYENGIVNGMTATTFGPDVSISREQIATIIYRYAEFRGDDVSARASITSFPDASKVSKWAKDALSWAVAEGIISGTKSGDKTILDPKGNATRAQVATILMRYLEK